MAAFEVMLEGHNFAGDPIGEPENRFGFFATRFVLAQNADEAGEAAKELVRMEFASSFARVTTPWDQPRLTIDSIREIRSMPEGTNAGASWYLADET